MNDLFAKYALSEYPKEACGMITATGFFVPIRNIASNPTQDFRMDPAEYANALQAHTVACIVHSHPDGPEYPSAADMASQVTTGLPWGILPIARGKVGQMFYWGGDTVTPPLVGRPFRHGVTDCYALIKDYYKLERGVELREHPRQWEWWNMGGDMYTDNLEPEGFVRIPPTNVQVGDCFFAAIRAKVPNHAGIYVGRGLMLHHPARRDGYDPTMLSRKEPLAPWNRFITGWIRYGK